MTVEPTENKQWNDKAVAFLVRSRQELWGKHNEDIMAWFFTKGFRNAFVKDQVFGWNRRSKFRSSESWGFGSDFHDEHSEKGQIWLPEGIVIPLVFEEQLRKLVIYRHAQTDAETTYTVPGSSSAPFILGDTNEVVAVVQNILDGFYLFQETGDKTCVIIPDNRSNSPCDRAMELLNTAKKVLFYPDTMSKEASDFFTPWTHACPDAKIIECDSNTMAENLSLNI